MSNRPDRGTYDKGSGQGSFLFYVYAFGFLGVLATWAQNGVKIGSLHFVSPLRITLTLLYHNVVWPYSFTGAND